MKKVIDKINEILEGRSYEIILSADPDKKYELGNKIHNNLQGDQDYIDNNIVLNIDEFPEGPFLYIDKDSKTRITLGANSKSEPDDFEYNILFRVYYEKETPSAEIHELLGNNTIINAFVECSDNGKYYREITIPHDLLDDTFSHINIERTYILSI